MCRKIYYLLGDLDTTTAYLDTDCKADAQVIVGCTQVMVCPHSRMIVSLGMAYMGRCFACFFMLQLPSAGSSLLPMSSVPIH